MPCPARRRDAGTCAGQHGDGTRTYISSATRSSTSATEVRPEAETASYAARSPQDRQQFHPQRLLRATARRWFGTNALPAPSSFGCLPQISLFHLANVPGDRRTQRPLPMLPSVKRRHCVKISMTFGSAYGRRSPTFIPRPRLVCCMH